uniref:Cytochrome c oxidase subunit 4 n=1 Tax=Glossina pallidipes TaxID=7398 RepID=A0A1B0ABE6_GLOPL
MNDGCSNSNNVCLRLPDQYLDKIGKREIVGDGRKGTSYYYDRADYPMPTVRFPEPTNEINNLHQTERGDWKKMSIDERKALYRASFCQTFAEIQAPTCEFKKHFGVFLLFIAMAFWVAVFMNLPITFDEEHKKAQLKRMIDLEPSDWVSLQMGLSK